MGNSVAGTGLHWLYTSEDFRLFDCQGSFYRYAANTPASPFFHLLPILIPQDRLRAQRWNSHTEVTAVGMHVAAGLKWDYQCLSTTGHSAPHRWGRGQLLICRSSVLPLPQMWLTEANQLSPGIQKKSKTRQTKDNYISAHFLKIETKKLKIQRHSDLLLCLPNKFFYSFQTEDN